MNVATDTKLRMVADTSNWRAMAGNNPLERLLNSFLTLTFIGSSSLPADTCLAEAKSIVYMLNYWEATDVYDYLEDQFDPLDVAIPEDHYMGIVETCIKLHTDWVDLCTEQDLHF